jgi:hypothetical protein
MMSSRFVSTGQGFLRRRPPTFRSFHRIHPSQVGSLSSRKATPHGGRFIFLLFPGTNWHVNQPNGGLLVYHDVPVHNFLEEDESSGGAR